MSCLSSWSGVYIELVCLEGDTFMFELLGFKRDDPPQSGRLIRMIHTAPTCSVLPSLTSLGENGLCFWGYTTRFLPNTPGLIASDGKRAIAVPTNEISRQPITIVKQDGSLPSFHAAMDYWSILAAAKERIRQSQHS